MDVIFKRIICATFFFLSVVALPAEALNHAGAMHNIMSDTVAAEVKPGAHDEPVTESVFHYYPTGFQLGLSVGAFYQDMLRGSDWLFSGYPSQKNNFVKWGPQVQALFRYQVNQHWELALQGAWLPTQKIRATATDAPVQVGDYYHLETQWVSFLMGMRLKMDQRYYFYAEMGPAYVRQSIKKVVNTVYSKEKITSIRPTVRFSVLYQLASEWDLGLSYQYVLGRGNWAKNATRKRLPSIQTVGIDVFYRF